MTSPRLSVVIPTRDGGDMLVECLDHLAAGREWIEVVLVDNGSTDGSIERATERFPAIRVVRNDTNRGYAPACNQGAAHATAPLVLFLNNDALLAPADLDRLLAAAELNERTAIWQPVTYGIDGTLESTGDVFTWWGILRHLDEVPATTPSAEVFATVGAAMLVRRDVFTDVGAFEGSYFAYYEESDLCWRVRMCGYDVRVVTDARVNHIGSSTTGQLFAPHDVRYLSFRNRIRTNLANPSRASRWKIMPLHVLACIGFVGFYLVTGRWRSAGAVLSALVWPIGNRDVWREQRNRVQRLRKRPDKEVFRRDLVGGFGPRTIAGHLKRSYWFERAAKRAG